MGVHPRRLVVLFNYHPTRLNFATAAAFVQSRRMGRAQPTRMNFAIGHECGICVYKNSGNMLHY